MKKCYLLWCLFQLLNEVIFAQNFHKVTATSGTQSVGGNTVTVTRIFNPPALNYCGLGPYWIGSQLGGSLNDGYIYTFSSPVRYIRVLYNALDTIEQIEFSVNSSVYPLTNANIGPLVNNCGPTNISTAVNNRLTTLWPPGNSATGTVDIRDIPIVNSVTIQHVRQSGNGTIYDFYFAFDTLITCNYPDSAICQGQSIQVPYSVNELFQSGNIFTAQLSDATGSFATPLAIGTLKSVNSGVINCNIPVTTPAGNNYRIRIVSSNPVRTSNINAHNIRIHAKPVAFAGNDTAICSLAVVQLNGTGGGNYQWYSADSMKNPGTATPTITGTASNKYSLVVTNTFGCHDTDEVMVSIIPKPVFEVSPKSKKICFGDSVLLVAKGGDKYHWWSSQFLDYGTKSSMTGKPFRDIVYSVEITRNICNDTDTLHIEVYVKPIPEVAVTSENNNIDCANNSVQLQATGATKYYWTPVLDLNDPTIATPVASPGVTTKYTVTGTSEHGCTDTATTWVVVSAKGKYNMIIPDAFTPNNDGLNDCYRITVNADIDFYKLGIYNRWGNRIFYTTNRNDCWDGSYKGNIQETGTYYYVLETSSRSCGAEVKKGNFYLLK